MLIGEYIYTIDQKKRVAIPAKFRGYLNGSAVITRGLDSSLVVYPLKEWEKLAAKLENMPSSKTNAREYSRMMFSGAMDVSLDKLGRILIPDFLKDYAGLKKNVSVIGLSNKIEIWDEEKWNKYKNDTEKEVGNIVSGLEDLGI